MKVVRGGKTRVLSAKLEASANHFNLNMPQVRIPSINMPEIHIPPMDFSEFTNGFGPHRATLGISADDLTPQLAQYFGVKQGKGVLVSEVTNGGPADKAGLKAGDVIVQVDGKPISGVEELRAALNDNFTGDTRKVSLTVVRTERERGFDPLPSVGEAHLQCRRRERSPIGDANTGASPATTRAGKPAPGAGGQPTRLIA
jgi:membrane-associated protease RseP (regulator of RpoE activity)